jgi:hypothetical protein
MQGPGEADTAVALLQVLGQLLALSAADQTQQQPPQR